MFLNYNELVSGDYFANDNKGFSYRIGQVLYDDFERLQSFLSVLKDNGLLVKDDGQYFTFNDIMGYLEYCVNFLNSRSIIDYDDLVDYIGYWYEDSRTYNNERYSDFHTIEFDNYSVCLKFYEFVFYIAELYLDDINNEREFPLVTHVNKYSSLSANLVFKDLEKNKGNMDWHELGFVTTVLRDCETNEELSNYYDAVLKFLHAHKD